MAARGSWNARSSSTRSVSAFSESFSCGEFGAYDLDLNEDDFEAMALEAELTAQTRMQRSKVAIDGLLEMESDGSCVPDDGNPSSQQSQSPPRGAGLAHMEKNSHNKWEPQKIIQAVENEGEGADNDGRGREISTGSGTKSLAISDEEISMSSLKRERKDLNIGDASVAENSMAFSSSGIKADDKSGIVLSSTQPGPAPNAAIHINSPNVTINYIVEQKVDSRTGDMSASDADSYVSWLKLKDGSVKNKDINSSDMSRGDGSDGSNPGTAVNEEDVPRPIKESLVQQTVHGEEISNFSHQNTRENEVPEFVTRAPRMSAQGEDVAKGENLRNPVLQVHRFGEDDTASLMTMSTCWSRKEGLTASTSSMSASVAASVSTMNVSERSATNAVKVPNAPSSQPNYLPKTASSSSTTASDSTMDVVERSSSGRSVTKTIKVANAPSSKPHDLSEMLDALWSPSDPKPLAQRNSTMSSDTEGSGVFTAGVTNFNSSAESGMSGNKISLEEKASLSQITEGRMPTDQTASKFEREMRSASERGPSLKSSSLPGGGDREIYNGGRHSRREATEDNDNRRQHSGTSSKPRSRSRGRAKDDDNVSRVPSPGEMVGKKYTNVRKDKSRSTSRGKVRDKPQEGGGNPDNSSIEDRRQSTIEGGGVSTKDALTRGQHVTFSNAPPKKMSMRDLLASAASDRDLSVYEDMSLADNDSVNPMPTGEKTGIIQMGAIVEHENGDGCSVASSVPEYKIDPGVAAFAKSFVSQFSKQEVGKQRRGSIDSSKKSMKEDGSDRSAVEEAEAARISSSRNESVSSGRIDNNQRSTQHKNSPQISRSQGRGKSCLHSHIKTPTLVHPHRAERSKSMHERPQSQLAHQSTIHQKFSSTRAHPRRPPSRGRRSSAGANLSHSQVTLPVSNTKYSIGDLLQSEDDVILDTNIDKILSLAVFDHCMVRRSGGRWTYSIVVEINEKFVKFVLDKTGSKKKIQHSALLHNVRRLK